MTVHDWVGVTTWITAAVVVAVAIWRVPAFRPARGRRSYWCGVVVAWMFFAGFLFITCAAIASTCARSILRGRLAELQSAGGVVHCEGRPVDDPATALNELATVRFIAAHHSSHGPLYDLRIGEGTHLRIARDSKRVHEYWIFWPVVSETSAIGRVQSLKLGRALGLGEVQPEG